ncbi:hypothetical protein RMATCC62417_00459 [Rhizopus microsporus]|nr:hypothetical protein RMATCC62417_00459 [Rhizopus microsporus]CEI99276.1 hypothetical protein RMCBS344292_13367 [Rhizopus microsporus]
MSAENWKPMAISTLTSNDTPLACLDDAPSLSPSSLSQSGSGSDYFSETTNKSLPPLLFDSIPDVTLHERRLRNKTASAKYRAKKNRQYNEMRVTVHRLTKENELLLHQVNILHKENRQLKITLDKFRGRMIAQKMLKQYLRHENDDESKLAEFNV